MVIESRQTYGRRIIYSREEKITTDNIVSVLYKALPIHNINADEIQYLWDYYKGKTPIRNRVKEVRSEIKNCISENRANEIVSFKTGYLIGEPIQYVRRGNDKAADDLNQLNEIMLHEDKATKDKELVEWGHICGTAYRMVLPKKEVDFSPVDIFTLDPRFNFIVYQSGLGHKPLMSVMIRKKDRKIIYMVYTSSFYYEIQARKITKKEPNPLNCIPVFEYPANNARLGAFETVLSLLDALDNVESNRVDGIEQFIQAILVFENCEISSEKLKELKKELAISVKGTPGLPAKVFYANGELNQTQTQTLVDDLYQAVLTICGMPNRNGGSSTSDTGAAVQLRDGWSAAESRAKDSEVMFKKPEKSFLTLTLYICEIVQGMNLEIQNIDIRFTRRNYENIQEKAQVLTTMLGSNKIHPELAFTHCGMFSDPGLAYSSSMDYMKQQEVKTGGEETESDIE